MTRSKTDAVSIPKMLRSASIRPSQVLASILRFAFFSSREINGRFLPNACWKSRIEFPSDESKYHRTRKSKPSEFFFLNCLLHIAVYFAISAVSAFSQESPPADFSSPTPETTITLVYAGLECETCYQLAQNLYAEAFGRLGFAVRIISLPSERSLIETNAGKFDGQVSRAKGFDPENRYPNLVIVPEPLLPLEVAAFALDQDLTIDGWDTLSETPYRITYQRGVKMIEQRLLRYIDSARLIQADNLVHAARLLVSGRVRILIGIPTTFDSVLELTEFQSAGIHQVGLLETFHAYPVLHKHHSPLVPELARVLREMKADGTFSAILQAYRRCRPGAPPQEP